MAIHGIISCSHIIKGELLILEVMMMILMIKTQASATNIKYNVLSGYYYPDGGIEHSTRTTVACGVECLRSGTCVAYNMKWTGFEGNQKIGECELLTAATLSGVSANQNYSFYCK